LISAIVPTCGAQERLARHLPSVRASLEGCDEEWEILVVDDGGGLRSAPEGAQLLSLRECRGYGPAVNAAAQAARGERLLILNDDVRLEESAVGLLREALRADGLFAVVPRVLSGLAHGGDEAGKLGVWRAGLLEIEEVVSAPSRATLYPVGCCYLCDRTAFLVLGGYDETFTPYLWEDVDLGYRAWRGGLATITVPGALCHHEGSATIGQRPMSERQEAWFRNWTLFHLRNVHDPERRAAAFGAMAALALFDERVPVRAGIAAALARFAEVGARASEGLSDDAILARVSGR
jgi:GT2 family glycosyltransferase